MIAKHWFVLAFGFLFALALVWTVIDLALENDGLKQVAASQSGSVQALLKYAEVATKCDVTPEEVASALDSAIQPMRRDDGTSEVAQLAFRAEFQGGKIRALDVTDVGSVSLCQNTE